MRKFILIAGFVLASAAAQAGDNRSLSLDPLAPPASAKAADPSQTAQAPQATETPTADAPKYVERPMLVDTKTDAPTADTEKPVVRKTATNSRTEKPRRKRYWTEGRIIGELHRHGIYW